jgi:phosphatidylglycerol:prolipoprotein diacylglycerol transferase
LAGVWVALNLVEREAPRHKVSAADISNLILVGLVAGIVGARLWYAARFLSVYLDNPLSLFSLNPSTLATEEGLLTGLLAAFIYGQRKGLRLWPTLDVLAPGLGVFSIALGFSHLASGVVMLLVRHPRCHGRSISGESSVTPRKSTRSWLPY